MKQNKQWLEEMERQRTVHNELLIMEKEAHNMGLPIREKVIREFRTGATRNDNSNQLDLEAYIHPLLLTTFGKYMFKHAKQADGTMRAGDNWQKGMPITSYIESKVRHDTDVWLEFRDCDSRDGIMEGLCGSFFNLQGIIVKLVQRLPKDMDLFAEENQEFIRQTLRQIRDEEK